MSDDIVIQNKTYRRHPDTYRWQRTWKAWGQKGFTDVEYSAPSLVPFLDEIERLRELLRQSGNAEHLAGNS